MANPHSTSGGRGSGGRGGDLRPAYPRQRRLNVGGKTAESRYDSTYELIARKPVAR